MFGDSHRQPLSDQEASHTLGFSNRSSIALSPALTSCQRLVTMAKKFHHSRCRCTMAIDQNLLGAIMFVAALLFITSHQANSLSTPSGSSILEYHQTGPPNVHYLNGHKHHSSQLAQGRVGGLDPSDYVDEAGELEIMANQQQIPTAQLMSSAGHIVPENFFAPGGSIPALYSRYQRQYQQHQQQQQQQQQLQAETMQQIASQLHSRHISPVKHGRQADLIAAAAAVAEQHDNSPLIDFNGYNLVSQQEGREMSANNGQIQPNPVDQVDLLGQVGQSAFYEQMLQQQNQQQQQQQQHYAEQQIAAELAALTASQNLQQQMMDNSAQASDNSQEQYVVPSGSNVGPAYQISGQPELAYYGYDARDAQKPYGLPTKSSSREPSGMLKPLGNPKTVSSPIIDMVSQLPKNTKLEQMAEKVPPMQTPTLLSFSSSKDPMDKVKSVNQKKRTVMKQAEQLAKMMIKSINDKLGTNIGDQTDLPFLLSTLTPLGLAQNILFDPTLLVTLLNSAEKTYLSDVLPGPAKLAMRPVLNIFRVPNKKRDKANLMNIISFLASGGQVPSGIQPKHRQGTGVERASKNKNNN